MSIQIEDAINELRREIRRTALLAVAAKHAQLLEGLENLGWPCRLEELPEYTRTLSAKLAESEAERDRERKGASVPHAGREPGCVQGGN